MVSWLEICSPRYNDDRKKVNGSHNGSGTRSGPTWVSRWRHLLRLIAGSLYTTVSYIHGIWISFPLERLVFLLFTQTNICKSLTNVNCFFWLSSGFSPCSIFFRYSSIFSALFGCWYSVGTHGRATSTQGMASKRCAQRSNEPKHNEQEFLSDQTGVAKDIKIWYGYAVKTEKVSWRRTYVHYHCHGGWTKINLSVSRTRSDARTFLIWRRFHSVTFKLLWCTHNDPFQRNRYITVARDWDPGHIVCTFESSGTKSCNSVKKDFHLTFEKSDRIRGTELCKTWSTWRSRHNN